MGGEGNLRHVVHRRVHLERPQPRARQQLGYLEKHKDYVKRAKDYHQKQDEIKKLQRKAYFKNKDEFSFAMVNHFMDEEGKAIKKEQHLTKEQQQLLESQDSRYIGMREQIDKKAVKKQSERLHFLDAERNNKHVVFVDEDDLSKHASTGSRSGPAQKRKATEASAPSKRQRLQDFDVASFLETHPALLGKKANRLRVKQLETIKLRDTSAQEKDALEAYNELLQRQERARQLRKVREEMELRHNLKDKTRKTKVKSATSDQPASYKWMYDRKR